MRLCRNKSFVAQAVGAHGNIRRGTLLLVNLALILSLLILHVDSTSAVDGANPNESAKTLSTNAVANLTILFPQEEESTFDDSEELAIRIAEQLGLGEILPFAENDHNLSEVDNPYDWENTSIPFYRLNASWEYATYHWWGRSASGNSTLGLLFNRSDRLVEIRAYPRDSEWCSNGNTTQDFITTAQKIAEAMAVPASLTPFANCTVTGWIADWQSNEGYSVDGSVFRTVYLWGCIGGVEVFGANHIVVDFVDGMVFRATVYPFFDGNPQPGITSEEAIAIAEDRLKSEYGDEWLNLTEETWVADGICLDEETRDIVYVTSLGFVLEGDEELGFTHVFNALISAVDGACVDFRVIGGYLLPDRDEGYIQLLSSNPALVVVLLVTSAALVAIALSWPPEHLIAAMAPLFILLTSIGRNELLANYTRGKIHGYILANPGVSLTQVKRALNLGNGTAMYHVNILLKNEMIVQRRAGNLVRLYDSDASLSHDIESTWTDLQVGIVRYLRSNGQMTASEIKTGLNISRQTLHHNLRKLSADGALVKSFSGGRTRFGLVDGIEEGTNTKKEDMQQTCTAPDRVESEPTDSQRDG